MRIYLPCLLLCLLTGWMPAQHVVENNNDGIEDYFLLSANDNWLVARPGKSISPAVVLDQSLEWLGISPENQLVRKQSHIDELGMNHTKYSQYFKGIKVYAAEWIIHEQNNRVISMNGRLVKDLSGQSIPQIPANIALQKAITKSGGTAFIWDDPQAESMIKRIRKNASATFYPGPELVWYHPALSQDGRLYRLSYRVEIYATKPLARIEYFIDAQTGEILDEIDMLQTTDVPGIAVTKYSGSQTITTDSVAPGAYRLRETGRGGGIETYDMNQSAFYNLATDFFDSNNIWDTTNAEKDEVATDAHWGAEMTYDYLSQTHNFKSFDNNDALIASYVHFTRDYVNAFWNGSWMTFGDGNGTSYDPLVSLDVVAHELAHGVTDYTSDLVYNREPGALNESFSDIIGAAVEYFADSANFDWFIGEDFNIGGTGFRSMSYPKSKGDPDTYKGTNWVTSSADHYGVHTNSGVQNKWFFLMSDGETGTNDNGDQYNISGLGIETAARIVFRSMQYYLTSSSTYQDARLGSIQAAIDLFGFCSPEVVETANAWYAVGVGLPLSNQDFQITGITSPGSGCGLSDSEVVAIGVLYNGCSAGILPGDSLMVSYQVGGGNIVTEYIVFPSLIASGASLSYTFNQKADLSSVGKHTIRAWVDRQGDTIGINDTTSRNTWHNTFQNNKIKLEKILTPTSDCHLSAAVAVSIQMKFEGCTTLPAGEKIYLYYSADGGAVVADSLTTANPVNAGGKFSFTFAKGADFSTQGTHSLDAWIHYPPDTDNGNDTIHDYSLFNTLKLTGSDRIMFLSPGYTKDSMITSTGSKGHASINVEAKHTGIFGLLMSGDNIFSGSNPFTIPDSSDIWSKNSKYNALACFCMDATQMNSAIVSFDLRQTYSPHYADFAGQDLPFASSMRILLDGEQILPTFHPATYADDTFRTVYIALDSMAGKEFEWCFQTRNFMRKSFDPYSIGDNAYIDNLRLMEYPVGIEIKKSNLIVYPNPAIAEVMIYSKRHTGKQVKYQVFDPMGRTVAEGAVDMRTGSARINIERLPSGLYFFHLREENQVDIFKIVKQ